MNRLPDPPALQYQTVRANGLEFHVAVAGAGPRLALCLHGFPENAFSWRYQIPLLARLGFRVWAPNLRGYGKTSRPNDIEAYAMPHLQADVAALIDASGATEVVLIGHDWGALIAWNYAMFPSAPIHKLIIMNVPHPALFEKGLRTVKQLAKSWYIFFFQLPKIPEWFLKRNGCTRIAAAFRSMAVDKSRFPEETLRVYREAAAEPGALGAMLNYYRALMRFRGRMRQRGTPCITVPTLMIWGEQDTAIGKELTYGTENYVTDLTLRYLPRVSHWVQQEAPETVNVMLEAWLTGQRVPEAREA